MLKMSVKVFIRGRFVSLFCSMLDYNHVFNYKVETNHSDEANKGTIRTDFRGMKLINTKQTGG